MTDTEILVGLTTIVVFGIGAQWIARRIGFPSLLLLLPAGLLAGGFGLVKPQELFGDTLFPLVTLLVALLLFQSGLQLRVSELPRDARRPVIRLVAIGGTITFLGASFAGKWVLGIDTDLAFLLGAIIVVSGPTVVGPLLKVVRPRQPSGSILSWEGTALDPVGATLGIVILNLVLASGRGGVHPLLQMAARLGLGVAMGVMAAAALVFVMSRFYVTDDMEAAVALLFVVVAFGVAEAFLSEAGLFAAVTVGLIAANQRVVPTARIRGFGETLEVLIIGTLFILLGALVEIDALLEYALPALGVTVLLVVLVRPVSVAVALARSKLPGRDRVMVGGMDPRGIVAAATAAQFSVTLTAAKIQNDFLLPVVFGVILGTGIIYGLGAAPLAKVLGVAQPQPKGVAIVGDAPWLADLARCLHECGVSVLLVSHSGSIAPADGEDIPRISLTESDSRFADALERAQLRQVLISSRPGALLTVVMAVFVERLGRRHVLQLPEPTVTGLDSRIARGASGRPFGAHITRDDIDERVAAGSRVRVVDHASADGMLVLATVAPDGAVDLNLDERTPRSGDAVIALDGHRH